MGRVEKRIIPYKPRDAFQPLHKSSKRWAVIVAHRRAGKTVACVNHLVREALRTTRNDFRGAYIAPFYRQAKSVAWDYVKRYTAPIEGVQINESELRIDLPNGSRIQLYGADNADALRGLYFDFIIADEYGDWKPSVWIYVIRPALADRSGKAIIIGTPKGRNQFYDTYQRAVNDPNSLALMVTATTSGILPQSELDALRSEMTEDAWRQEMDCDFDAAIPGAIYGREMYQAEAQGRICEVEYDPSVPVHTAWDLGYSDDTSIWFYQVVFGEVHVIDFYSQSGRDISHYVSEIQKRPYKYGSHNLPHDARAKTLASGGRSIIEQLGASLDMKKLRIVPHLDLQDGIQAARMMFPNVWFNKDRCSEGMEALRQYQREWDEDKKAFKDKPRHDWTSHASDAFRYMAVCYQEEARSNAEKPFEPRGIMVGMPSITVDELNSFDAPRRNTRI